MRKGIVAFLMAVLFIVFCGFVGNVESYYYRDGVVVECDNDVIVVVDNVGEEWICGNDYKSVTEGCHVRMRMFNCHTNNIFDDEIRDVKVVK